MSGKLFRVFWACQLGWLLAIFSAELPSVDSTKLVVKDIDGIEHTLVGGGNRATVLFFVATDCPISNGYAPEINRICARYARKNIDFYMVYADRTATLAEIRKHAQEFEFQAPVLFDASHSLVRTVGATVTPEVAVLGQDGNLLYRGRIDDLYVDIGKRRNQATSRDLRDALDAIVHGSPVPHPTTTALGCFIPTEK